MMNNSKVQTKLFALDFVVSLLICVSNFFQKTTITSALFYITFFILILIMAPYFFANMHRMNLKLFSLILLPCLCVLFNYLMAGGDGLSFNYIKKLIMFISTILLLFYATNIGNIERRVISKLCIYVHILTVFYIIMFVYQKSKCFYFKGRVSEYLTFGMENPNLTGIYIVCFTAYLVLSFFLVKNRFLKLLCCGEIIVMIYFLLLTRARNAFLSIVLFSIIVLYATLKKRIIPPLVINAMIWYPLAFVFVYLIVLNNATIQNLFSFLISEGKSINSRYISWVEAFDTIIEHPIIGAYSQISNGTGVSQMLNTHIDVLASYGIPVFVIFMTYLSRISNYVNSKIDTLPGRIALMGFFACLFSGTAEAAFVSGGTGVYILICGLLLIANSNFDEPIIDYEEK